MEQMEWSKADAEQNNVGGDSFKAIHQSGF
jgi:hypothetical protein